MPTLGSQNAPPLVAALLNVYPRLSSSGPMGDPAVTGFSEYAGSGSLKHDQQTWGLRLDHVFNDKLMSFVRYNRAPSSRLAPMEAGPSNTLRFSLGTETLTIGLTQALSPKLVNEIRLNGSRQFGTTEEVINSIGGAERPPDSLFFPPGYSSNDSGVSFGVACPPATLGFNERDGSRQVQIVDNLSWNSGAHQFKAGADYRWFSPVATLPRFDTGFYFPSIYGSSGAYSGTIPTGSTLLLNIPSTAFIVEAFSAYVQDTWKARRGLTITYGLRWEVDPAPRVSAGQAAILGGITNSAIPSTTYFVPSGKPFYATSWSNLAPRLGLGWQINDGARKTVLRVGAGRFFDLGQGGFENNGYNAPTVAGYTNQPLGSPTGGSPTVLPYAYELTALGTAVGATHGYNLPYTAMERYDQAIHRTADIFGGIRGRLGRRLGWIIEPASGIIAPWGSDFVMNNDSSSSYNAMQLQFNRRLSSRLHMLVSYTWAHSIDDLSQDTPYGAPGNYSLPFDPRAWGSSDFDVRHSLNGSIITALPSPHGGMAGLLFRNWTANSIFFARSALPTDVMPSRLRSCLGLFGQPAERRARSAVVSMDPAFLAARLTARVLIPPNGQNGDLGVLRGLGARVDFALHREFRVSEA